MAGTKISELTELTTPTGEEELVYAKDGQNGKIKLKNAANSIILEGGSMGTFIKGARASGTLHEIDMGTNRTYTFQGAGYVLIKYFYGWACEINGLTLFEETFNSGTYNMKYVGHLVTMGPGDVVRMWRPGNNGNINYVVADYY